MINGEKGGEEGRRSGSEISRRKGEAGAAGLSLDTGDSTDENAGKILYLQVNSSWDGKVYRPVVSAQGYARPCLCHPLSGPVFALIVFLGIVGGFRGLKPTRTV